MHSHATGLCGLRACSVPSLAVVGPSRDGDTSAGPGFDTGLADRAPTFTSYVDNARLEVKERSSLMRRRLTTGRAGPSGTLPHAVGMSTL